jgi:zinc protease
VEKGEHFALVAERGGTLNGTTSADRTNYFEVLPADELELALFLEADRMRWLNVDRQNFENQCAVVQEEYRMRVSNAPYAEGLLRLRELVFADYPPYAHPPIGSLEQLAAAQLEWVAAFHRAHYAPNNAVLTIAGNFMPEQALALVRQYFGAAERRDVAPFRSAIAMPSDAAERERETLRDANANAPALLWGYRIPPFRDPEHYALEIAALLLTDGESSRLQRTLVREQALLQIVSASTDDQRGPDQFTLFGVANEGTDLARVEQAFADALRRLRQTNASAEELERVKSRLRHDIAFGLQSHARRAIRLGEYELLYGDARLYADELAKYLEVSADDVRRAAQRHLVPERRSELAILPAPSEVR